MESCFLQLVAMPVDDTSFTTITIIEIDVIGRVYHNNNNNNDAFGWLSKSTHWPFTAARTKCFFYLNLIHKKNITIFNNPQVLWRKPNTRILEIKRILR